MSDVERDATISAPLMLQRLLLSGMPGFACIWQPRNYLFCDHGWRFHLIIL